MSQIGNVWHGGRGDQWYILRSNAKTMRVFFFLDAHEQLAFALQPRYTVVCQTTLA